MKLAKDLKVNEMLGKVRKSTLMETSNPEIVMANADLNGLGYGNISVEDS